MKHSITFIRSAQTQSSLQGKYTGLRDEPLDALAKGGLCQMQKELGDAERVYAGGFQRCRETAELLYPQHDVEIIEELLPLDYGDYTGKAYYEIHHDTVFLNWASGKDVNQPMPGAEFFRRLPETVQERNLRIFESIVEQAAEDEIETISIVAHSSFIRHMMRAFCTPRDRYFCIDIPKGGRIDFIFDSGSQIAYLRK